MVKRFSITMSDFIFDNYLNETTNNRSRYIEKLIVLGTEAQLNENTETKGKMVKLLQEKNNLEQELRKSKLIIENLKIERKNNGMSKEDIETTKMAKAIKNSGFMRRL